MKAQFSAVVAVGDPQTTLLRFQEVLSHKGLLSDDGRVRDNTRLIVLGDYFDFGDASEKEFVAREGLLLLRWLASHSEDQVSLVVGNHDLARIGELALVSDEKFDAAISEAHLLYGGEITGDVEQEFLSRYPEFPSIELVARDFCAFLVEQRSLVLELLRTKRLRLAAAHGHMLFCHAGVTSRDLEVADWTEFQEPDGITTRASSAAEALNRMLDSHLANWTGDAPFFIPGFHTPGSSQSGEGGGALFHRPAQPGADKSKFQGPHRRCYDPRNIPAGIIQVVGHVRDKKCRQLLGEWVTDEPPASEGALRGLVTDGARVAYQMGFPQVPDGQAGIAFLDGGMNYVEPQEYQVLDVIAQRGI